MSVDDFLSGGFMEGSDEDDDEGDDVRLVSLTRLNPCLTLLSRIWERKKTTRKEKVMKIWRTMHLLLP